MARAQYSDGETIPAMSRERNGLAKTKLEVTQM